MKTSAKKLYENYSNKSHSENGVLSRMKQRSHWHNKWKKNGTCDEKLKSVGVLR